MKKINFKRTIILVLMLFMMSIFTGTVYAESSVDITQKRSNISSKKISYGRPATLKGTNFFNYLSNYNGVYCLDHTKGLKTGGQKFKQTFSVTSICNKQKYILGCQVPSKSGTYSYQNSLIQNYIWKYPSRFKPSSVSASSAYKIGYDFNKITNANDDYNEYEQRIEKKGYVYPGKVTESKVTYKITESNLVLGTFTMRDYTYGYSSDCAYVNKKTKYNSFGSSGTKAAGLLSGIVDAEVVVTYGGKTKTLKYSKGDFKFSYPNDRDSEKKYKTFPLPKEKFYIKISKDKIDTSKKLTVKIKFQSIRVTAKTIKNADVYTTCINSSGKSTQPLLLTDAGMTTKSWTDTITLKISPPGITGDTITINTFICEVKGGGENGCVKYDYTNAKKNIQYKTPDKVLKQSSRSSWETDKKKEDNRAMVEDGDEVTFCIRVTNLSKKTLKVEKVTYSGCKSGTIKKFELAAKKSKDSKVTVTVNSNDDNKYLKAKLGDVTVKSTGAAVKPEKSSSKDCFSYKKYNVSIDKYITNVNGQPAYYVQESDEGSSTVDDEDDKDDISDEEESKDDDTKLDDEPKSTDYGYEDTDDEDNDDEPEANDIVYLQSDGSGNIKNSGITDDEGYYIIYRAGGDEIACFEKEGRYYYHTQTDEYYDITNDIQYVEPPYFIPREYEVEEGDPVDPPDMTDEDYEEEPDDELVEELENVYLQCDSAGNIEYSSTPKDKYFYEVKDTSGNVVAYYHKAVKDTLFIYNEESESYDEVALQSDVGGKFIIPDEAEENEDYTYLEIDDTGEVVHGAENSDGYAEVKDMTGTAVVCYYKDWKYYYRADSESSDYTLINFNLQENGRAYIVDAECVEGESSEGADVEPEETYEDGERVGRDHLEDNMKEAQAYPVQDGNTVEYEIVLRNTQPTGDSWGVSNRKDTPYYQPSDVVVDVKDALPLECIEKGTIRYTCYTSDNKSETGWIDTEDTNKKNEVSFLQIRVPAGGYTTIKYSVTVSCKKAATGVNTARIGELMNGNATDIKDFNKANDKRKTSSDYFKVEGPIEYPPSTSGGKVYVNKIEHSMMDSSIRDEDISDVTKTFEGQGNGVYAEYGDKVKFGIKVENTYSPTPSDTTPFSPFVMDYYSGPKNYEPATALIRIELPDEIYQEEGKYKVLINDKEYDVNSSQKNKLMLEIGCNANVSENLGYDNHTAQVGLHDNGYCDCSGWRTM